MLLTSHLTGIPSVDVHYLSMTQCASSKDATLALWQPAVAKGLQKVQSYHSYESTLNLTLIVQGKTNFFERRVGEYQRAGVTANCQPGSAERYQKFVFRTDVDF